MGIRQGAKDQEVKASAVAAAIAFDSHFLSGLFFLRQNQGHRIERNRLSQVTSKEAVIC